MTPAEARGRARYLAACVVRKGLISGFGTARFDTPDPGDVRIVADWSFATPDGIDCLACGGPCDRHHFLPRATDYQGDDRILIRVRIGGSTVALVAADLRPDAHPGWIQTVHGSYVPPDRWR